jgi:cysteinyl-tRNA synthetase
LQFIYQKTKGYWDTEVISDHSFEKEFTELISENKIEDLLWFITRLSLNDPEIAVFYGKKLGLFKNIKKYLYNNSHELENLLEERSYCKVQKNFEQTEALKEKIFNQYGLILEDSKEMQYWRKSIRDKEKDNKK